MEATDGKRPAYRVRTIKYNVNMNIRRIIDDSYDRSCRALVMGTSPTSLERARERVLLKTLAEQLQTAYEGEDVRVFSTYGRGNRTDFGTETLLHDISVCRIKCGETAERQKEDFVYIAAAIWQVEFDFSREWPSAIRAINRLNAGSADNKLLVAAQMDSGRDNYMKTLIAPFAAGHGDQHLALIPHPAEWDTSDDSPEVWRLSEGEWVALT